MALISCSECGASVSDKARACPKCGNPINTTPEVISYARKVKPFDVAKIKKIIITAIVVVAVIFIGKGFIHPDLKFEDLKFGDARASALLGYASGHNEDGKYWDNCVKLYGLKVDYLEYSDGW